MQLSRRSTTLLLLSCFLSAASGVSRAQTIAGSISGSIVDPSKGAVPHATVSIRNTATNATYQTVSDAQGLFVFPVVLPGTYTLDAESPGFKKLEKSSIVLNANSSLNVGTL